MQECNLETLKDLVSIASFDTNDNTKIIEYLTKKFKKAKELLKLKSQTHQNTA